MVAQTQTDNSDFQMMDCFLSDPDVDVRADPTSDDSDASTVESECEIPPIQRTKSQLAKQLQLCRVVERLSDRSKFIQDLERIVLMLDEEGIPEDFERASATVTQAQKEARNLGEDLMEDLLSLDSLSNLTSEDRMARKKAVADIEALLTSVDTAKVELGIFRKKLDAKLPRPADREASTAKPIGAGILEPLQAATQTQSPKSERDEVQVQRNYEKVKRLRSMGEKKSAARPDSKESLFAAHPMEPPGRELWEQIDLPIQFHPHEERHGYVIEANVPELDIKDVRLRLSSDEASLMIEGVRLPSPAQKSKMQRIVTASLEQFAQRSPQQFAQLGGVPGMSKEAFIKVGQGYFGRFSKTFSLPDDVAVSDIEASYDDGRLKVVLPKKRPAFAYMVPTAAYQRHNPFHGMPFR